MLIVDSAIKKNSDPETWPARKSEKQPEPWCLACTWNLVILIPEERSTLFEQNMHIDSSLLQPKKFSCSACEESQRRRLQLVAARVLHEPRTCLQIDQFEWKHPVLNLHVLGTLMLDAGSRAASVTLLNHWIKYQGKPNIVKTDPERAF